jgi:3-methyladenine DNA glycosylase AlkD
MCRVLVKEYRALSLSDTLALLRSSYHDERQIALLMLVHQFAKGDAVMREKIVRAYLANTRFVNNWDLVDCSAHTILGAHCIAENHWAILNTLARSSLLWERRIAIVATYAFIRNGQYDPTITIARTLLRDTHDLIHKAVGWMLREVGKRDASALIAFLDRHAAVMPRTMLRYAIERFSKSRRTHYLSYGKQN